MVDAAIDTVSQLRGALGAFPAGETPVEQRGRHVAERRQVGDEVELLEYEADPENPSPAVQKAVAAVQQALNS